MYCLSNEQIDFILNDISARGVKMDSLQQDLLDHICCIIEHNLEENGDFENFYQSTIKTFYKEKLAEIEEETKSLIDNKHFYTMKKAMIMSGGFSTVVLTAGIILKFLHLPGAGISLVVGITTLSLIFLPLMFTLKIKEKQGTRDKMLIGLGTLIGMLFCMATMFKLMHWPGANLMGISSIALLGLLFIPVYFVTGIRKADTKVNTIVSSILLFAACGLFLGLSRSPQKSKALAIKDTGVFVRSERILENEYRQTLRYIEAHNVDADLQAKSGEIFQLCAEIKAEILAGETGHSTIGDNFENEDVLLSDDWASGYFQEGRKCQALLKELKQHVKEYNSTYKGAASSGFQQLPIRATLLESTQDRVINVLGELTQLQMLVLQNQQELSSAS